MVNGTPLFTGTTEESQLETIFRLLGTPNDLTYPGISELPEWRTDFKVHAAPANLEAYVTNLEPAGVDLLQSMLIYDPAQRITAQEARNHEYFNDLSAEIRAVGES